MSPRFQWRSRNLHVSLSPSLLSFSLLSFSKHRRDRIDRRYWKKTDACGESETDEEGERLGDAEGEDHDSRVFFFRSVFVDL